MPGVLQLISSGGFYGAESVALGLAAHFRGQGWTSAVGVLESPGAPAVAERAVQEDVPFSLLPASPRGAWSALGTILERDGFDIVHAHGYKTDVITAFPFRKAAARRVSTCHGWLSESPKLKAYEWLDRLALRRFDRVAAVSPHVLGRLHRGGIARDRCSLVDNGVQLPAVAQAARAKARDELCPRGGRLIVRVGRLDRYKGNDVLLRAFAGLQPPSSTRLVFVGEGDGREALDSIAASLGVAGQVAFTGYRTDVPEILAAADLMVISSTSEGLPMVMLEAMALNLPIVSTSVGSIAQVLQDGRSAWLVPPGDPDALAGALGSALNDYQEANCRASAAREKYLAQYSREAMGRRYEAVYGQVLRRRGVRFNRVGPTAR